MVNDDYKLSPWTESVRRRRQVCSAAREDTTWTFGTGHRPPDAPWHLPSLPGYHFRNNQILTFPFQTESRDFYWGYRCIFYWIALIRTDNWQELTHTPRIRQSCRYTLLWLLFTLFSKLASYSIVIGSVRYEILSIQNNIIIVLAVLKICQKYVGIFFLQDSILHLIGSSRAKNKHLGSSNNIHLPLFIKWLIPF